MPEASDPSVASAELLPLILCVGATRLEIEDGRSVLAGSGPGNELRINHGSISTRHARITRRGETLLVEDLGSELGSRPSASPSSHQLASADDGDPDDPSAQGFVVPLGASFELGRIQVRFEQSVPLGVLAAHAPPPPALREEPTFHELMAEQLRRTPWLGLSLVFHALLLLLLQYVLTLDPEPTETAVVFSMDQGQDAVAIEDAPATEAEIEVEQPPEEVVVPELRNSTSFDEPAQAPLEFSDEAAQSLLGYDAFAPIGPSVRSANDDVLRALGPAGGAGDFKSLVGKLRKSGLEIMFVFDSTQSMDRVLSQTKTHVAGMIDALHALVPEARVGVVTYRDSGSREDYVTRHVPLSDDYYRTMNFIRTIDADGGGDIPEAVLQGLESATRQDWKKGAQRVVILIGDAPAHEYDMPKIRHLVRNFAKTTDSYVHTITTPRSRGTENTECREQFTEIAQLGGGACISLEDQERILHEVLSLAFGRSFRQSIDEVFGIVARRSDRVSASARDMVKRGDLPAIEKALENERTVDDTVKALLRSRDPKIAHRMLTMLRFSNTEPRARHAANYVLQSMLDLTQPPLDAERQSTVDSDFANQIAQRIDATLK